MNVISSYMSCSLYVMITLLYYNNIVEKRCHMRKSCSALFNAYVFFSYSALKHWLDDPDNFKNLCAVFSTTSNYAKLQSVHTAVAGRLVYIRFRATTGDAMGMNMLSKVSHM